LKFKIISLGCPKNLVESEYIVNQLEKEGHVLSEECDTVVINTCAFIGDAAKESIETILTEAQTKEEIRQEPRGDRMPGGTVQREPQGSAP
jgi:ribosomal protein S12 methylthiotransferase